MKKKVLIGAIVGLILATAALSVLPEETKAATTSPVSVLDISCESKPITYDHDEEFKAWISNSATSDKTVEVDWYLDGGFVKTQTVTVPAQDNDWTPPVTIHWPDDFQYHDVTAKIDEYNAERTESFRASLITD
ncbi:MAG: hypothetical protein PHU95_04150 [Candidatus Thermoplasmatota archaeon]|nr:hypothetical protein [Candidatus Thermoplasmatota archaeon]